MGRDLAPASGSERRRPRVVIVAPVHGFADVRVFQKEAITLAAHGYRVALLARPSGALGSTASRSTPYRDTEGDCSDS